MPAPSALTTTTPRAAARAALPLLLIAAALLAIALGGSETASANGTFTVTAAITSDPGADNEYHAGDTITATATFAPAIDGHIGASLAIVIGSNTRNVTLPNDSTLSPAVTTLDFNYVVTDADQDADGITVASNALSGNFSHTSHSSPDHTNPNIGAALATAQAGHKVNVNTDDYDTDADGLIEIDSLLKLNAVRYDLNGDGAPDAPANAAAYAAAFPARSHSHGCPDRDSDNVPGPCEGYELTANLDFDDGVAGVRTDDSYYGPNGYGWSPFGAYSGDFVGNSHTIANLYISLPTTIAAPDRVGLFGTLGSGGTIKALGVTDASITRHRGGVTPAGALVGWNDGTITGSWSTGSVLTSHTTTTVASRGTGGLVGYNNGTITASWSSASATARGSTAPSFGGLGGIAGGLAGFNNATITACYATGASHATGNYPNVGGLVGWHQSGNGKTIHYSYAIGGVTASGTPSPLYIGGLVGRNQNTTASLANNHWGASAPTAAVGVGQAPTNSRLTTAQMQSRTNYGAASTDPFYNWNAANLDGVAGGDDPWDFGTASQYPVLNYGGNTLQAQGRGPTTDYDTDDDGLIDITKLTQLNAIRYDLDGDGAKAGRADSDYHVAFPNRDSAAPGRMGCPNGVCTGYELMQNLDFDQNGSGAPDAGDPYYNSGAGWTPIVSYGGDFVGHGHTIANLYINLPASTTVPARAGLFGTLASGGEVRGVGITDASVTLANSAGGIRAGALVGWNDGTITASYATGAVSVSDAATNSANYSTAGGLVGENRSTGTIKASYAAVAVTAATTSATASSYAGGLAGLNRGTINACYATGAASASAVHSNADEYAGGLVGVNVNSTARINACYATGAVAGAGTGRKTLGGLIGENAGSSNIANSYWDTVAGHATGIGSVDGGTASNVVGQTTAQLQAPTEYAGIYANWNINLDAAAGGDDPWNFGTTGQYPVLHYGAHTLAAQGRGPTTDYDTDNDGLIDIRTLAQLDAVRYDLDGDGGKAVHIDYHAAFPNRNSAAAGRMGCPDGACTGYELRDDLDFAADPGGPYANWAPIGAASPYAPYNAAFHGNGHTIANLSINTTSPATAAAAGLFAVAGSAAVIESVALTDVSLTATYPVGTSHFVGALVGWLAGAVRTSYATGEITVTGGSVPRIYGVGGLVGQAANGSIAASYAGVSVSVTANLADAYVAAGGLVGETSGSVTASYATGTVVSNQADSAVGGLLGTADNATVSASYWDTNASDIADDADDTPPEGQSAAALQSPTRYRGIYETWDDADLDGDGAADAPWHFGDACQYPALNLSRRSLARQRANDPPCPTTDEYVAPPIVYNLNIRFSVKGLTLDEGASATYQVRMSQAPVGHPARVSITSNNPDVTVSPTELTFSSANWNQWQTVKVTTLRDPNDTDESATLAHRGPNLSYGSILVSVNDTWPGATTETVNGRTVTLRHTQDAPYGVTVTAPSTLDTNTHITIAGPPPGTPQGAPGYGLGQSAAARMLADIRVSGTPAAGLTICLPLPPALLAEAGDHPLTLLRYANGAWTPLPEAERRNSDGNSGSNGNGNSGDNGNGGSNGNGNSDRNGNGNSGSNGNGNSGSNGDGNSGSNGNGNSGSNGNGNSGSNGDGNSGSNGNGGSDGNGNGGSNGDGNSGSNGNGNSGSNGNGNGGSDGADGSAMLCAAGVTEYGVFAAAYTLPALGPVSGLAAAPGDTPGSITLTWTPGANAAVHWIAGIRQDDPHNLAVWTIADAMGSHTVSGLEAGATYIFTVTAGRGEGDGRQWTAWAPWASAAPAPPGPLVRLGSAAYAVDLAVTASERAQGLSGRPSLAPNRGMLFVYNADAPRSFWMLNMRFPLDLVWIRADCTVAGITADVPHPAPDTPRSDLPHYPSPAPVRFVLEINAGQAAQHNIAPGAPVTFAGTIANKWGC